MRRRFTELLGLIGAMAVVCAVCGAIGAAYVGFQCPPLPDDMWSAFRVGFYIGAGIGALMTLAASRGSVLGLFCVNPDQSPGSNQSAWRGNRMPLPHRGREK